MRTTIDLPEDIHRLAAALARSHSQTLSQTISELLRRSLLPGDPAQVSFDDETGLPGVRLGRPITAEDVAASDDES